MNNFTIRNEFGKLVDVSNIIVKWDTIVGKSYQGKLINIEDELADIELDDGVVKTVELWALEIVSYNENTKR